MTSSSESTFKTVVWDIETDGLLREVSKIHCQSIRDVVTNENMSCTDNSDEYVPMLKGYETLKDADKIIGHNIVQYDAQVLKKLLPRKYWIPVDKMVDTLILSRLIWPEIKQQDFILWRRGTLPGNLIGSHSLKAWGYRLGILKGDYGSQEDNAWDRWTPAMQEYMDQDTVVTRALWFKIKAKLKEGWLTPEACRLEHQVASLCQDITNAGWPFDVKNASKLYGELSELHTKLNDDLQNAFPPMQVTTTIIPKVNNSKLGYVKGRPFLKRKVEKFNPSSMDHVAKRLFERYGWDAPRNPETGRVNINDDVLNALTFPEIETLRRYLKVNKVLASLATGRQAWLKMVWGDDRIHTEYNTCGAVTTRSAHRNPNIAQVPSVAVGKDGKPLMGEEGSWGWECRKLFGVPQGWYEVGVDMSGIELRCLANRLAPYDNLLYASTILSGDIHTMNQQAAGWPTRAIAKTGVYGWLYGAGSELTGSLTCPNGTVEEKKAEGIRVSNNLMKNIKGLKEVRDGIKAMANENGWIVGLDGRRITVRKPFAALNAALQSDGAILAKRWLLLFVQRMEDAGYVWGKDWWIMGWIHDELANACRTKEIADDCARLCLQAIREAGEYYGMAIRLDGEAKIGRTWAETH